LRTRVRTQGTSHEVRRRKVGGSFEVRPGKLGKLKKTNREHGGRTPPHPSREGRPPFFVTTKKEGGGCEEGWEKIRKGGGKS